MYYQVSLGEYNDLSSTCKFGRMEFRPNVLMSSLSGASVLQPPSSLGPAQSALGSTIRTDCHVADPKMYIDGASKKGGQTLHHPPELVPIFSGGATWRPMWSAEDRKSVV